MRVISQCAHLRRVHRPARCRRSNRARTEDLPDWQDPYQIIGRGSLIRRRRRGTDSRHQAVTAGHLRTQRRRKLRSGGPWRTREDTRGHATRTVRDREAPGSNPGPDQSTELKFAFANLNSARTRAPHGFQPCALISMAPAKGA